MVKGVNRQIIEISRPEHQYFERALLIVRSDLSEEECARLYTEADRLLNRDIAYSAFRRGRRKALLRRLLWGCGGALLSAAATWLFLRI